MFFVLSKLLSVIISPIIWIVSLLLFSLLAKTRERRRKAAIMATVLILFFSNSFVFSEFMRAWEVPVVKDEDIHKTYDYGIVVGGMLAYDRANRRINFKQGIDRLLHAIELYKSRKINKIFITGGSGSLTDQREKEAIHLRNDLLRVGFPEKDLLIESDSKNTRENALFTAEILLSKNEEANYLLITSAYHMRRAIGCFKKAGIQADAYPTDFYTGPREYNFADLFIPYAGKLNDWSLLIHEVVGCVVYEIMGYT